MQGEPVHPLGGAMMCRLSVTVLVALIVVRDRCGRCGRSQSALQPRWPRDRKDRLQGSQAARARHHYPRSRPGHVSCKHCKLGGDEGDSTGSSIKSRNHGRRGATSGR